MTGLTALILLLCVPLVPFLLAVAPPRWRRSSWQTAAALAAVPALVTSVLMPAGIASTLPWLLEGSEFGLDEAGRIFLFASAVIWLAAGVHARVSLPDDDDRGRFFAFFLLVMSGNLGLIVARDMLAFYLFFVLMSFASYGLIVHDRSDESKRAGRVYMTLVVGGDMLLFAAIVLTALDSEGSLLFEAARGALATSPYRDAIVAFLILGFGVKVGLPGLHITLPLIYRAAPTPARAVLAGAVINAGLLAWLRFLPFGTLPAWGTLLIAVGIAAAFAGAAVGTLQRDPAAVLGYSSISQMGIMTAGVGAAIAAGEAASGIVTAVVLYATHHAFAKSALFLGADAVAEGPRRRPGRLMVAAGLLLPALALAGAPFTSGMVAKEVLKESLGHADSLSTAALASVLPWTAAATTLVVLRFLWLVWPRGANGRDSAGRAVGRASAAVRAGAWGVLLLGTATVVWLLPVDDPPPVASVAVLWDTSWPVVAGSAVAAGAAALLASGRLPPLPSIPAGDIVVPAGRVAARAHAAWRRFSEDWLPSVRDTVQGAERSVRRSRLWLRIAIDTERLLGRWGVAVGLFVALALLFALTAIRA